MSLYLLHYVPGFREVFRSSLQHISLPVIFKKAKLIHMHPKDKISMQLKENIVHKWFCPEEIATFC